MIPLTVRTHFHSCASITSPASPSKYPAGLAVTSIEDWRRSVSGPTNDKEKSFKYGTTGYVTLANHTFNKLYTNTYMIAFGHIQPS